MRLSSITIIIMNKTNDTKVNIILSILILLYFIYELDFENEVFLRLQNTYNVY